MTKSRRRAPFEAIRSRLNSAANSLGRHRVSSWLFGGPEEQIRPAISQGILASILITVGSWGVGFLPQSGDSIFSGTTILVPVRTETTGVIVSAVLLILGCLLLMRAWLRLGQRIDFSSSRSESLIVRAIWYWTLPMLASFPIFSRDVFSYLAQGRLFSLGGNPYEGWVSQLPGWFMLGADGLWAESHSPYGPLFLATAGLFWLLSGQVPEVGVFLFRLLSVASMWLLIRSLGRMSVSMGQNSSFSLWLVIANPLFLIIMIAAAHNDVLMLALLIAATCLLRKGRFIVGLVLFGHSIAIKPIVVVLVPFLVFLVLRGKAGVTLPKKIGIWFAAVIILFLLLGAIGAFTGLWFGWFPAMLTSGSAAFPYAPVGLLGLLLGWFLGSFNLDPSQTADIFYKIIRGVAGLIIAWGAIRTQRAAFEPRHTFRDASLVLLIVVLSAPIIQPWYLLWVLPLFVLWNPPMGDWLRWLYFLIAVLLLIGVIEQFSVAQWIPQLLVQGVAALVGAIYLLYLVALDPKTSRIFLGKEKGPVSRGPADRTTQIT